MSTLPLFPLLGVNSSQAKPHLAEVHLSVWLHYLSALANSDASEIESTRVARADVGGAEITCLEYALVGARACYPFVSDEEIATLEAKHGFSLKMEKGPAPFMRTAENHFLFSRPLAFANVFGLGWGARAEVDHKSPLTFKHVENPLNGDWFQYYGTELRQDDLSVFLLLAKKNERMRPGVDIRFDARQVLKELGRTVRPANVKWLVGSIIALQRAHITLYKAATGRQTTFGLLGWPTAATFRGLWLVLTGMARLSVSERPSGRSWTAPVESD
jgi:hypothetical protein